MSQHDYNLANQSRTSFRTDANNALAAILSQNSGATTPTTTTPHMFWADTTDNLLKRRNAADSGWIVMRSLSETFVVARSSNTILGVSDVGKTFRFTGTFTQTLTAAATLGDGWCIDFINEGTGVITFDPNGAETIDGATTLAIPKGASGRIVCNGTNFKVIFRTTNSKIGTITRDMTLSSGSVAYTGVGFTPDFVEFCSTISSIQTICFGWDDATGSESIVLAPTATTVFSATKSIQIYATGSALQDAKIASMDADGFTLSWTKTNSPTGTANVNYRAVKL